jgi:hypothetical protein
MKDSDPRPMPPEVKGAYRSPLALRDILGTDVFSDRDKLEVRDALLRNLLDTYGNAEVPYLNGYMPIAKRVGMYKKNAFAAIGIMIHVADYGGKDRVLPMLADIMQPYWNRWWDGMSFDDPEAISSDIQTYAMVLGKRQLAWINAQVARSVSVYLTSDYRDMAMSCIVLSERYAISGDSRTFENAYTEAREAREYIEEVVMRFDVRPGSDNRPFFALMSASEVISPSYSRTILSAISAASSTESEFSRNGTPEDRRKIAELVKSLITPTLITKSYEDHENK